MYTYFLSFLSDTWTPIEEDLLAYISPKRRAHLLRYVHPADRKLSLLSQTLPLILIFPIPEMLSYVVFLPTQRLELMWKPAKRLLLKLWKLSFIRMKSPIFQLQQIRKSKNVFSGYGHKKRHIPNETAPDWYVILLILIHYPLPFPTPFIALK